MIDTETRTRPAADTVVKDRRRPGRIENASPELIALMRRPTSASARAQVALYDAPGFLLQSADSMRRARAPGFALRVSVAVVASGIAWAVAFKVMWAVWG